MSELSQRDLAVFWHPCSQMTDYEDFPPLEIRSAQGSQFELADGRKIYDAISSWWCKSLGHCHPHIQQALIAQAQKFEQVIMANTCNEPLVRLCERLLAMANGYDAQHWGADATAGRLPGFYGKVFLADGGSMAMEIAMKMAVHAHLQQGNPQRQHFMALQNGYHGETIATLSAGDLGLYNDPYRALLFPVEMINNIPYRLGEDDPRWQDASAEWPAIEAQLDAQADTLAAILYEPIMQGAGGMLMYSPDLLRRLRMWADQHGVYLIADEIAAGFGRCGKMLASFHAAEKSGPFIDHAGFLADFTVVSKGLTSGVLPLSAVLCSDDIYNIFLADYCDLQAFMHSNTYTGNALAVAVAHAAMDIYADEKICEAVCLLRPTIHAALEQVCQRIPQLHNLRSCGMLWAVDLRHADGTSLEWTERTGYHIFQRAIERGAWLRPLGDTMYLFPPLNTSEADVLKIVDILEHSITDVLAQKK